MAAAVVAGMVIDIHVGGPWPCLPEPTIRTGLHGETFPGLFGDDARIAVVHPDEAEGTAARVGVRDGDHAGSGDASSIRHQACSSGCRNPWAVTPIGRQRTGAARPRWGRIVLPAHTGAGPSPPTRET